MNNNLSSEREKGDGPQARVVLMAGFLGAGKTEAAAQFVRFLQKRGKIAAVITNDHGAELVDSTSLCSQGILTESLQGGALCGRQEEFGKIAQRLVENSKIEVLIAEPIGTCAGDGS